MKYYSYEEFKKDTNGLIKQVREHKPDAIVAIARGGLIISHCVCEGLGIRDVQTIRTELYDENQKRDKITIFGDCDFQDKKRVLVLDDISDSGDTLESVMNHLKSKHEDVEFKTATLFYKKTSVFEPDVWINEANEWIDFFWEADYRV